MNIVNNLEQNFIVDVQVSNTKCPQDYLTIFEWDWLGTANGCDCTASNYFNHNQIYQVNCNYTEIAYGCIQIEEQPAVFFDAIEGAANSKQLVCVKRGNTRFSDAIADQQGSCSSSQKQCGNPLNKGTIICVEASEPCPIYDIQKSASQDLMSYPAAEWKEFHLDSGDYLYVSINGQSAEGLPLSETRFTQIPENKYYSINVPQSEWNYMKGWNQFEVPKSTVPFESFKRPFINWKIEERSLVKGFVDAQENIKSVKKAQLAVFIINIIVCIVVSVIVSILQLLNFAGKDIPCIRGTGEYERREINSIKEVLNYGSKFIQLPFILWAFFLSKSKKDQLNEVANSQPSDARFNSEIANFADQLENDVYEKNLIALIVLGITILVDLSLILKDYLLKAYNNRKAQKADNKESLRIQSNNAKLEQQQEEKDQNFEHLNTQQPLNSQLQETQHQDQNESFDPQLSPYPDYAPPPIEQQQQQQPIRDPEQQPQIEQMGVPIQPKFQCEDHQGDYGFEKGSTKQVTIQQPEYRHSQQRQQPYLIAQGENYSINDQKSNHE